MKVRSEMCMVLGWGGMGWGRVGREDGKKGLESLDLARVLGVRGLPTGQR